MKNLLVLLFISSVSYGQNMTISQICDYYKSITPIKIDKETTLKGVACTDEIFGYNYNLSKSKNELDFTVLITTEALMINNLNKSVNSDSEMLTIRKSGRILGFSYFDSENRILFAIFYTIDKITGKYEYNKSFSERVVKLSQ